MKIGRMPRTLAVALLLGTPHVVLSQTAADTATSDWPVAAWASGSLGVGSVENQDDGVLAQALRLTMSIGPLLFTYRKTDNGPWGSGDGVREGAILAGVRSPRRRVFVAGALGYGEARPTHRSEGGGSDRGPQVHGLAYDLTVHANAVVPGVAVVLAGITRAPTVNCFTVSLALELGWFGY
jgi:hypothetical protein